jgi:hypothetical protein
VASQQQRSVQKNDQPPTKLKIKKVAFARNHTPIGSSQETTAYQLGTSVRTVTRHLAKTESVQVMYKVTDPDEIKQAEGEIYLATEFGDKTLYFARQGEIYRFGNSLYNLNETLKSEFTQRVKYKFNLFKKMAKLEIFKDKNNLLYYHFKGKYDPNNYDHNELFSNYDQDELFKDFRELFNCFDLDSLDEHILMIMFYCNHLSSFGKFFNDLKYELRKLRKWERKKFSQLPPLLATTS